MCGGREGAGHVVDRGRQRRGGRDSQLSDHRNGGGVVVEEGRGEEGEGDLSISTCEEAERIL